MTLTGHSMPSVHCHIRPLHAVGALGSRCRLLIQLSMLLLYTQYALLIARLHASLLVSPQSIQRLPTDDTCLEARRFWTVWEVSGLEAKAFGGQTGEPRPACCASLDFLDVTACVLGGSYHFVRCATGVLVPEITCARLSTPCPAWPPPALTSTPAVWRASRCFPLPCHFACLWEVCRLCCRPRAPILAVAGALPAVHGLLPCSPCLSRLL